jgi:hypothetical protein
MFVDLDEVSLLADKEKAQAARVSSLQSDLEAYKTLCQELRQERDRLRGMSDELIQEKDRLGKTVVRTVRQFFWNYRNAEFQLGRRIELSRS